MTYVCLVWVEYSVGGGGLFQILNMSFFYFICFWFIVPGSRIGHLSPQGLIQDFSGAMVTTLSLLQQ